MATQIILCCDCTLVPPSACDVVITDPPYRDHVHDAARRAVGKAKGVRKRDLGFESLSRKARQTVANWASHARRWTLVYSDVEHSNWLSLAVQARGVEYIRTIPWVRWSSPQFSGDRPPQGFEHLLAFHPSGKKRWRGAGNLTHLAHLALRGEGKHPTEKPLDQALDLVSWFSEPGELVVDPFAGSGVVGLACRILGRSFLGFELSPEWAGKASSRLVEGLSDRDRERLGRWLASSSEPIAAQEDGPSVARAQARQEDKERGRAFAV